MGKKRPISPLEVEPSPQQSLSSLQELISPISDPADFQDLLGDSHLDLHSSACLAESQGKVIKASKAMLGYLAQAALRIPALLRHWKCLTSQALTILTATVVRLLREEKVKTAGKLLRVLDSALQQGLKTEHGKWHKVRIMHL